VRRLFEPPGRFGGTAGPNQAVVGVEDFNGCRSGELFAIVAEFNMARDLLRLGKSAVLVNVEEPEDGAVVLPANVPPRTLPEIAEVRRRTRPCFDQRAAATERIHGVKGLDGVAGLAITKSHPDVPSADHSFLLLLQFGRLTAPVILFQRRAESL